MFKDNFDGQTNCDLDEEIKARKEAGEIPFQEDLFRGKPISYWIKLEKEDKKEKIVEWALENSLFDDIKTVQLLLFIKSL